MLESPAKSVRVCRSVFPWVKHGHIKLFYLTVHFKAPPMATPISIPNLLRENVVLPYSSLWKRCYLRCVTLIQLVDSIGSGIVT